MLDVRPHAIPLPMADNERAFYVHLGERIATTHKAQGITQVQLAEQLGVAPQTMAHYEAGSVRIAVETLTQLATILETSIEDLIGHSPTKTACKRGPASKLQQQLKQISRLPKAQQKFVSQMLDTVLQQAQH